MTHAPGDGFRSRVLQPVVDAVDAHLGANCFALASAILATFVGLTAAGVAHDLATGAADLADFAVQGLFVALAAAAATHLHGFGRRRHRGTCRVVHPVFRQAYVFFFVMSCVYPLMRLPAYGGLAAGVHGTGPMAWTLCKDAAFMVFSVGFMVAGCEWRRLPPAGWRRPAAGRFAPSPA